MDRRMLRYLDVEIVER